MKNTIILFLLIFTINATAQFHVSGSLGTQPSAEDSELLIEFSLGYRYLSVEYIESDFASLTSLNVHSYSDNEKKVNFMGGFGFGKFEMKGGWWDSEMEVIKGFAGIDLKATKSVHIIFKGEYLVPTDCDVDLDDPLSVHAGIQFRF